MLFLDKSIPSLILNERELKDDSHFPAAGGSFRRRYQPKLPENE